jgi:hypothetical protein
LADHPPHLPPAHPDRPEHPQLAGAFEHRQHEVLMMPKTLMITDRANRT